jgi:hypothetical protein
LRLKFIIKKLCQSWKLRQSANCQFSYPCFLCVDFTVDLAEEDALAFGAAGFSAFGAAFFAGFFSAFVSSTTSASVTVGSSSFYKSIFVDDASFLK